MSAITTIRESLETPISDDGVLFTGSDPRDIRPTPFTTKTLEKDAVAGTITGLMAIPLTIGICLLSEYPIQIGLATVCIACVVSFTLYLFRPGNHVGVPGVAAGLAPVLALGVHRYGMENMPWLIFLTAISQLIVWRYELEGYILKVVPAFLIEGLLAGVGLKIATKFLPYTYEGVHHTHRLLDPDAIQVEVTSAIAFLAFVYLYKRLKDTSPGLPYIAVIVGGVWLSFYFDFPMLHVEPVAIELAPPFPDFGEISPYMHIEMVLFAMMLSSVDVIEQVMSNAAIEKIDPLGRKTNSSNSLLTIWVANLLSSCIGGMTNLDGLAKSSTNRMAGAVTKLSNLFVAAVLGVVLVYPQLLAYLPEFALAVLMIFTGWKMIAGLYHVAHEGKYGFGLALFCGVLVFRLGIFEGLLIALAVHSFITYVVYRHQHMPLRLMLQRFVALFASRVHPHSTPTMVVNPDAISGGLRYCSIPRHATSRKSLDDFIQDWADGVNRHSLLSVVSTYHVEGLLWGTFAKDLRAGHFHIKRYFEHLFELEDVKVRFTSGETRQYHDIFIRSGSYVFSYRKKGAVVQIPARYSFVCKQEKTGWYILDHHSSEFPA